LRLVLLVKKVDNSVVLPEPKRGVCVFARLKARFNFGKRDRRPAHLRLGELGEALALQFLKQRGYEIVATNYLIPLGRALNGNKLTAEIDIVAYDGPILAFIEVKTRRSDDFAAPERAVDLRKKRQIARAARRYRRLMNVSDETYRYDVVTVIVRDDDNEIELLRGYFDDSVFHRSRFFREY
jgi:putative endonuclease